MAYTPKTWTCGELITDEGLNNIEQGIQEALGCCESELPEVTAADNGDVLTVVDGEWAKAEGGGTKPLIVQWDNNDTSTHTWREIYNALADGLSCYFEVFRSVDGINLKPIVQALASEGQYHIVLISTGYVPGGSAILEAITYSTDAADHYFED